MEEEGEGACLLSSSASHRGCPLTWGSQRSHCYWWDCDDPACGEGEGEREEREGEGEGEGEGKRGMRGKGRQGKVRRKGREGRKRGWSMAASLFVLN